MTGRAVATLSFAQQPEPDWAALIAEQDAIEATHQRAEAPPRAATAMTDYAADDYAGIAERLKAIREEAEAARSKPEPVVADPQSDALGGDCFCSGELYGGLMARPQR